jgi:hypothetical protein
MEGTIVEATGILRFYRSPESKSHAPSVARSFDHFYFDAETTKIRRVHRE